MTPETRAHVLARVWRRLTSLERRELTWLLVGLGGCVLLFAFLRLAGEVMGGETMAFDRRILLAFRKADDPSLPIEIGRAHV